ncbi:hypothetical protein Leryth_012004 [Lithospermum erythrorhizon]|nr:hypothetical protein Leryth_012004 [Lithospermum erythrorhizon]
MAEMKDAHVVVEIAVDAEHQQKIMSAMNTISAMQEHPLKEISNSPGHLLLLKLWQREEDLHGRKIASKETRMHSIKNDIFQLCCFFLMFHAFFLTILFTSSLEHDENQNNMCHKWWIPSILSICTSLVIAFLVQLKLFRVEFERYQITRSSRHFMEVQELGSSFYSIAHQLMERLPDSFKPA